LVREEERTLATREGGRVPFTQWLENLKYNFRDEVIRYSLIYRDGQFTLNAVGEGAGQAWIFDDVVPRRITDILFYLNCSADFNGSFVAMIYAVTGTPGTDAVPAGVALATSDAKTQADLVAGSWQLCNLHFSTSIVLDPGVFYAFVIELSVHAAGDLLVGRDETIPTAEGNYCSEDGAGWAASTTIANCYYVYENYLGEGVGMPMDVIDRWARQLGQIDLARYMGAACGPGNPIDVNAVIAGFVDVSDRAARLLGIIYGNQAQLQQLAALAADGLTPTNVISAGIFPFIYDPVAADWNRWRQSTTAGVPLVEDTGTNTNPRRYEKDNGFYSAVVARAGGVATALWTIATTPARTAGQVTTIYTLTIENSTGAAVTAWLEIGGTAITVPFHVANNDSVVIPLGAGLTSGDADVNCNASVNGVNFSIFGTEV
jgi:hypothetical protein